VSGTTSIYEQVYSILDRHPLAGFDCGELCGKLCCCYVTAGEDESGVELLPGVGAGSQYNCALVKKPKLINQKFVESVKEAAALLLEIPEVRQLVDWDSMNIEKDYIRMKIGL